MKFNISLVVAVFVASGVTPGAAWAEPSCSPWMDQGDGTSWRECVDDNATTHCYRISNQPGSTAYEVPCKS